MIVAELLSANRASDPPTLADANPESEFVLDDFDRAYEILMADVANYEQGHLDGLRDVARRVRDVGHPPLTDDEKEDTDEAAKAARAVEHAKSVEAWDVARSAMAHGLDRVANAEAEPSPWRQVVDALTQRLPKIQLFDEADRDLASVYDLVEVADSPPPALMHLASLADLDLVKLRDEAAAPSAADVGTPKCRQPSAARGVRTELEPARHRSPG